MLANQIGNPLPHHDRRGVGVARNHGRHDRGVGNAQPGAPVNAQFGVDNGPGVADRKFTAADRKFTALFAPPFGQNIRTCVPIDSYVSTVAHASACLPLHSYPYLHASAERWIRSVKEECLSRLILFGEASLRHALAELLDEETLAEGKRLEVRGAASDTRSNVGESLEQETGL